MPYVEGWCWREVGVVRKTVSQGIWAEVVLHSSAQIAAVSELLNQKPNRGFLRDLEAGT